MMQLIRPLIVLLFPVFAYANQQTDPDRINHLGGAFAGVECYNSLAIDMASKNKAIEKQVLSKIPRGNSDRTIFKRYIKTARQGESFCRLQKTAYAKWRIEKQNKGPRYYDYDVVYFECIYNKKQEENRFLTQLLEYLDQ
jgi:hypothetical protein